MNCTDIIFDLGGILLDLNMQGVGEACKRLGINPELFFVKADEENTSTVCHGISASKAITDYQVGKMTTDEFLSLVLNYCDEGITKEDVIEAWNACIGPLPKAFAFQYQRLALGRDKAPLPFRRRLHLRRPLRPRLCLSRNAFGKARRRNLPPSRKADRTACCTMFLYRRCFGQR